nr:polysaccharide deacetylase family protein [Salinihabitans flavidus]
MERLAALSDESGVPLHLALIPAQATPALADWIADRPDTIPLIHGWSHDNHAPEGAKKAEFGQPRAEAAADLRRARDRLRALFGARLAPVFVPPWNRFDASLPPVLTALGLRALSAFTPRAAPQAAPGLARINTHVDPIDWRGTRDLIAPGTLIAQTAGLLRERREGCADNAEPFGLLTHHLAHDALVWDFCRQYLLEMRAGPTALWRADRDLPAREDTT